MVARSWGWAGGQSPEGAQGSDDTLSGTGGHVTSCVPLNPRHAQHQE